MYCLLDNVVDIFRVIWMQESVIHEAAAQRAREARMEVIMDSCILKEHMHYC